MSTATLVDTDFYLRTSCPSNRRAALQRYLHETSADVVDDQIVIPPYASAQQFNVVVTRHPTAYLATHQSNRIKSSGEFHSDVFESLEAAMSLPEFLVADNKSVLPILGGRNNNSATGICSLFVESAGSNCILKSGHNGNCRTK